MPSLIDPREREIPILPDLAAYTYSAEHRYIACCLEFLRHGIVNSCRDFLATNPIACKVSVAIHQRYFDAAVKQVADGLKVVWAEEIAGTFERFGHCNVLYAVIDGYA